MATVTSERRKRFRGERLPAKLVRPAPVEALDRPRVYRSMDHALRRPILWINGPAGSGKTTLVAKYLEVRNVAALWYQLDAGDGDIASFFYCLSLAAKQFSPKAREPLPLLTAEYLDGVEAFAANYFRRFFSRLKNANTIVFDNFQDLPNHSRLDEILRQAMEQLPIGIQVIIMSREEPPSGFARLCASGRIGFLGWEHLKLTQQECFAIATRRNEGLNEHELDRIYRDTQGWAAGVVLLSEHGSRSIAASIDSDEVGCQYAFDYFASEIFRLSDAVTQVFLLKTSILQSFTAAIARTLTGMPDVESILHALMRRNLFTFRRADGSFEYHPLFRAFLLKSLRTRMSDEEVRLLKRKSAQLLMIEGNFEGAIILLQEARDWEASLQLVLGHARAIVTQGRTHTVANWLGALPEAISGDNPRALYWQGICELSASPRKARQLLEKAFVLFEKDEDTSSLYLAWSAIIDSFLFEADSFSTMLPWLERYPQLGEGRPAASVSVEHASVFTFLFALLGAGADRVDLHAYARRADILLEDETDQHRFFARAISLVPYYLWRGDITRARGLLDRLAPHIRASSMRPQALLNWHMSMSLYSTMTGAPEDSLRYANEARAMANASGVHSVDLQILIFSIRGQLCMGNTVAARELLEQLAVFSYQGQVKSAYFSHHSSLVALHEGNFARAIEEGRRAVQTSKAAGMFIGAITSLIGLAYAYAQSGDADNAIECLAAARFKSAALQSASFASYCALCDAIVHKLRGERAELLSALTEALSLARIGGFITSAYCTREVAAQLYAVALDHEIESEYVTTVIHKTHLLPPRDPIPGRWPWRLRIVSLGSFVVRRDGSTVDFGASGTKAQKKPLELLRAIVAFGGRHVNIGKLAQALWPDTDGVPGSTFRNTLLRLRRIVGEDGILQSGHSLSLNPDLCWLDVWELECLYDRADDVSSIARTNRLFELYGGRFLPDEESSWAIDQRERLRSKVLREILSRARALEVDGDRTGAIDLYRKGLEIEPFAEEIYRGLMKCYDQLNRPAEALSLYHSCRSFLRRTLQIEPDAETRLLYRRIQQRSACNV